LIKFELEVRIWLNERRKLIIWIAAIIVACLLLAAMSIVDISQSVDEKGNPKDYEKMTRSQVVFMLSILIASFWIVELKIIAEKKAHY
jgi:hypothetical protein